MQTGTGHILGAHITGPHAGGNHLRLGNTGGGVSSIMPAIVEGHPRTVPQIPEHALRMPLQKPSGAGPQFGTGYACGAH
ncbi:MAG: hypothetical protein WCG29_11105 [Desulfomonile sp.]|nr:hypothetical protein [Deltaproteobacteria bacterium]